jgi:hypothetical protein
MTTRPLKNRVDPFGALHATSARGTLMGNRGGRFHNDDRTLGARRFASRRWIACVCEFRGRHRDVWGASYTELFFLDEVTALAAGHRPCFECRREDSRRFARAFGGGTPMSADEMDIILDRERRDGRTKRLHPTSIDALPDGAMIARQGSAFALRGETMLPWGFGGYGASLPRPRGIVVDALTPPSISQALASGYHPDWHARSTPATPTG